MSSQEQNWKLGTVRAGQNTAWSYDPSYARQVVGGVERLVIAGGASPVSLLRELLALLPAEMWVLYVLVTPRGTGNEAASGRYQSARRHSRQEVLGLLDRYESFLNGDGRHNLWLAAPPTGQLVYDRHDVIYAYGPLPAMIELLKQKGFAEVEALHVPIPHSHHYHERFDTDETAMLKHWEWLKSELQETDNL